MAYDLHQHLFRAVVQSNSVWYERWRVYKPTPKGGWITRSPEPDLTGLHPLEALAFEEKPKDRRWVAIDGRFASETPERALARLRARTASYVAHCRRRLKEAERRASVVQAPSATEFNESFNALHVYYSDGIF